MKKVVDGILCALYLGKRKETVKNVKCWGKWVFKRKLNFWKIIIFLLAKASDGCFGPGVEEQAGKEPLGERP